VIIKNREMLQYILEQATRPEWHCYGVDKDWWLDLLDLREGETEARCVAEVGTSRGKRRSFASLDTVLSFVRELDPRHATIRVQYTGERAEAA
jgi:hypothetical protein